MMKILALDSSGLVASVAIIENDLTIAEYNIRDSQKNYDLFLKYVKKYNITGSSVGTPLIITKGIPFVGWDEKTQVKLLETINK